MITLHRNASVDKMLTNTELISGKPVPAFDLTITFEGVAANDIAALFPNATTDQFRASFWDKDGDVIYTNMEPVKVKDMQFLEGYRFQAFRLTHPVSVVSDWKLVPIGGHRAAVTVKLRFIEPSSKFHDAAFHRQKQTAKMKLEPMPGAGPTRNDPQGELGKL